MRPLLLPTLVVLAPAALAQTTPVQQPAKPATGEQKPPADQKPKPGKDRWKVKTAADKDAGGIAQKPVASSVEKLLALPRPADFPVGSTPEKYQDKRAGEVENTIYSVEVDITEVRLMPDGDYRVVLKGASGQSMVMEMPDPDPAFTDPNSPFAYAIKAAREQFEAKVKPEKKAAPLNLHARITGLGFFGRAYGKPKPDAGNLVQLHPVLNVDWMDKPSADFKPPAAPTPDKVKTEPTPKP